MIPIQYFISPADVREALATGCRWVLLADCPSDFESALCDCRAAGCLLTVCDDAETVRDAVADGLLLTSSGIAALAARRPEPSGIVLQRPHPVTSAVHVARGILGEDSPQIIGVAVDNASDVVAAAKAGADYVLLPAHAAIGIAARNVANFRSLHPNGIKIPFKKDPLFVRRSSFAKWMIAIATNIGSETISGLMSWFNISSQLLKAK